MSLKRSREEEEEEPTKRRRVEEEFSKGDIETYLKISKRMTLFEMNQRREDLVTKIFETTSADSRFDNKCVNDRLDEYKSALPLYLIYLEGDPVESQIKLVHKIVNKN